MLKRPRLPKVFQGKVFKDKVRERAVRRVVSFWTFFWLAGGEVIGSQHRQPSISGQSGGSIQLTSPTCWGSHNLQNSSSSWLGISVALEEKRKVLDFVQWLKLLLFCLNLTVLLSACLTSLIQFVLWLKLFYRQKTGRGHGGGKGDLSWEVPVGS